MPTSAHCSCAPGAVNPVMPTRVIVGMDLGYVGQTSNTSKKNMLTLRHFILKQCDVKILTSVQQGGMPV